jgi:SAM-dependent methyltransferase
VWMAVLPDLTDDRLVLQGGIWSRPDEHPYERWSADAAVDPIHAAISATGVDAERTKSRPDIEFLAEHAVDGIVLDLGCGYGRVAKYLLPLRCFDGYVGIDGSMTMLRLFHERHESNEIERNTPLMLVHGSIDDIKLTDASVDTVVIAAVLLHNPKRVTRAVVAEARRVLRPGGRLLVLSDLPNSRTLAALPNHLQVTALALSGRGDRNGPVRTYSRPEVRALFADFEDVRVHTKGHSVLPKRLPGVPESLSRRYRTFVHDPVQRWAEHRIPATVLDRMYANVRVVATR